MSSISEILSSAVFILLVKVSTLVYKLRISFWNSFVFVMMWFLDSLSSFHHSSLSLKSFIIITFLTSLSVHQFLHLSSLQLTRPFGDFSGWHRFLLLAHFFSCDLAPCLCVVLLPCGICLCCVAGVLEKGNKQTTKKINISNNSVYPQGGSRGLGLEVSSSRVPPCGWFELLSTLNLFFFFPGACSFAGRAWFPLSFFTPATLWPCGHLSRGWY